MSSLVFPSLAGLDIAVKRTPVFATKIQTAASGKELRASFQAFPRYRYELRMNFLRQANNYNALSDEAATLMTFLAQHKGAWDSFLFQDPYDSSDTAMGFGVGNGSTTAFQLQRREPGVYSDKIGTYPIPTTPRANQHYYSEQMDNGTWSKINATVTANASLDPNGFATMDALVESTTNTQHSVSGAATYVVGQPYTLSVYARPNGRTKLSLVLNYSGAGYHQGFFDIPNLQMTSLGVGGAATGGSGTVTYVGDGIYRVTLTGIAPAGAAGGFTELRMLDATGAQVYLGTGLDMHFWGMQLEPSAFATQYIPTTSAAVTVTPSYYPGTDGFEPVTEPAPKLQIYKSGVLLSQISDWSFGAGGMINFTVAPAANAVLTWSGGYYRRVRFDGDSLDLEQMVIGAWDGKTVKLVSVK